MLILLDASLYQFLLWQVLSKELFVVIPVFVKPMVVIIGSSTHNVCPHLNALKDYLKLVENIPDMLSDEESDDDVQDAPLEDIVNNTVNILEILEIITVLCK